MSEKTIPELLHKRVKEHGTRLLFQRRDGWSWKQITWLDFDRKVKNIASFLMHLGLGRGDRALIVSSGRLEAISAEMAIFHLGGVIVPLSIDESVEKITQVANELNVKLIFIEQGDALEGLLGSLDRIPNVERIAVFPDARIKNERIINFKNILKFGLMHRKKLQDELTQVSNNIDPDAAAAFFVLPGSDKTGVKEISQNEILTALEKTSNKHSYLKAEDQSFSCLTAASPFAKFINYLTLYNANRAAVAETRKDFYEDMPEVMPTILFETKGGLEKICENVLSELNGQSPEKMIRAELGGRINHIFVDYMPGSDFEILLRKAGVNLAEIPELTGLVP
ncbi:MAG: AMP-binding protein [Deltaproteobacteria bacterium]